VLASAAAVGFLAVALTPLTAPMALVLGAVPASTDPVAVTALGRRLALPGRVQTMVQAESLFNDATSLVLFKGAVGLAVASSVVSWPKAGGEFFLLAGGGSVIGAAVAGVVALIRARTTDPVLETVIALVTPYAAYVLAEGAHTSGVTAVVVAGAALGRSGYRPTDARIRLQLQAVYSVVVFPPESVVFATIGLELPTMVRELPAGSGAWPLQALALAAVLIRLRVLWVRPLSKVVKPVEGAASWRVAAVVTWAGTRGVMPLAAALSIPLPADDASALPGRPLVLVLTTAVVVFTLVVQGLNLAPLVNHSGLALEPQDTAREQERARQQIARAGLDHLDQLADLGAAPDAALSRVRLSLDARLRHNQAQDPEDHSAGEASLLQVYQQLRHEVIVLQGTELQRMYDTHQISDTTRRQLHYDLDLEESGLSGGR